MNEGCGVRLLNTRGSSWIRMVLTTSLVKEGWPAAVFTYRLPVSPMTEDMW